MMQSGPAPSTHPAAPAPVFAALGDPTRLAIVAQLCDAGPLSTVQLRRGTGISRQAITKHLQMLEAVGLVHSARAGRDRLWQVESDRLQDARAYLDQISRQWDAAIDRLRLMVEEPAARS